MAEMNQFVLAAGAIPAPARSLGRPRRRLARRQPWESGGRKRAGRGRCTVELEGEGVVYVASAGSVNREDAQCDAIGPGRSAWGRLRPRDACSATIRLVGVGKWKDVPSLGQRVATRSP